MTAPTILLVEDDPALRMLTARALQENGFNVRPASAAPEMWLALDSGPVDLVLLDIMLPGTSGIDLCRSLRQKSDVPIIFMSARSSETDRVVGLELGADDYIAKPFGVRELVARVRAVLRRPALDRRSGEGDHGMLRFEGWTVNLPRRELTSPTGASVDLTGAEFDLLVALADHAQRVIARYHLDALSADETRHYIAHRMAVAGLQGPLPFQQRALARVHALTGGVPRRINLLCDRALLGAYGAGVREVTDAMVRRVVDACCQ
jgi:DNA-binding response OmpR family regulator